MGHIGGNKHVGCVGIVIAVMFFGAMLHWGDFLFDSIKNRPDFSYMKPRTQRTAKEVYRKCLRHEFSEGGYTVSATIDLVMNQWQLENPGERIRTHSGKAIPTSRGWWRVSLVLDSECELQSLFEFDYHPNSDTLVLHSGAAEALFAYSDDDARPIRRKAASDSD